MSRLYYRGANACVLCYDITDEASFHEMTGWLAELKEHLSLPEGERIVVHVVGTKSDVVAVDPGLRQVPFERTIAYIAEQLHPSRASTPPPTAGWSTASGSGMGIGLGMGGISTTTLQSPDSKRSSGFWAQDIGWDCCHEISAKDGEGIEEVFRVITRKLVEQKREMYPSLASADGIPSSISGANDASNTGSFRVGHGDRRRSWLGFPPSMLDSEEGELTEASKKRGRCC